MLSTNDPIECKPTRCNAQERERLRAQIADLQSRLNGHWRIPARVLNGSLQEVVAFKSAVAEMVKNRIVCSQPGATKNDRALG